MERTLGTIGIDMCFATTEAPKPMVVHAAAFCRSERELQFGCAARSIPLVSDGPSVVVGSTVIHGPVNCPNCCEEAALH